MSEPFLGEIRILSFTFAPKGWALCDGQLLPISQNTALFSILGTTYGGDGKTTFALPNFRGRLPMHPNFQHPLGESGGEETHLLSSAEIPAHSHAVYGVTADAHSKSPADTLSAFANLEIYSRKSVPSLAMNSLVMDKPPVSSQPHDNMQPFLTLSFAIALQGIFPSRN